MIREVDLVSYLPSYMQSYKEPVAALEAENPEFNIVWKATDRVLYNRFISTADEYGISRFEKILGIYPSEGDSLEDRRSRVQTKWFNRLPYTMQVLLEKVTTLCHDTDFSFSYNFHVGYTINLTTSLSSQGQLEEMKNIIETIIPCNIVVDHQNLLLVMLCGNAFIVGGITQTSIIEITNKERVI